MISEVRESEVFESYNRRGRPVLWVVAFVCAGVATCALFAGYVLMHKRFIAPPQSSVQTANAPPPTPRAQILEDEPFLRNSQAVIGGSVRNISNEMLENVAVILELMRYDETKERRTLALTPSRLAPGEEGRYSLTVPAREWNLVHVVQLRDGNGDQEIAFNTGVGRLRPAEAAPSPRRQTQSPRPRTGNDEFYNTPDNPVVIR